MANFDDMISKPDHVAMFDDDFPCDDNSHIDGWNPDECPMKIKWNEGQCDTCSKCGYNILYDKNQEYADE